MQLSTGKGDGLFGPAAMESSEVATAIRDAVDDPNIKAIIFRVDSPGGSYVASDTIWSEVQRARELGKPVIVSMGEVAASGGYFVSAPATKIVAQPGTITGSIGVAGGKVVFAGLWNTLRLNWDGVKAGANADMESPHRLFSNEGWARMQEGLDRVYADFTQKVAAGRNLPIEKVQDVAKGQVWTGSDARDRGLVDELGGYSVAIRLARDAAKIPAGSAGAASKSFRRQRIRWRSCSSRRWPAARCAMWKRSGWKPCCASPTGWSRWRP